MKFKEDKSSLKYQLRQLIYEAAVKVVGKRAVRSEEVILEHPAQLGHGDYATNIALKVKLPAKKHLRGFSPDGRRGPLHLGGETTYDPICSRKYPTV